MLVIVGAAIAQEVTTAAQREAQPVAVVPGQPVVGTSYVSPLVELFGDIRIGERSFVASNTILRASPERRVEIGNETNAQDNILVRALDASSTIGNRTSLAQHAMVRDSDIGDFVFVGFNAEVVDSTVEDGAFTCTAPWSRA